MGMTNEQCANQIAPRFLRGEQIEKDDHAHGYGLGEPGAYRAIPGDEPIGDNRKNVTGINTRKPGRARPATHGGTLRCLIEDVQSQRKALLRRIARHQEEILEYQEELIRQRRREETLIDLLENWQRNVAEITDQGD